MTKDVKQNYKTILDLQKTSRCIRGFFLYNDFYFFHYSWFPVFCQFSTVQHGDQPHIPVHILCSHILMLRHK